MTATGRAPAAIRAVPDGAGTHVDRLHNGDSETTCATKNCAVGITCPPKQPTRVPVRLVAAPLREEQYEAHGICDDEVTNNMVVTSEPLTGNALVTGGGRGIGARIARELADAGMRVAVASRTADEVRAVAAEIRGAALVGDVSRLEDVERWVREVGEVDLLVANAGVVEYAPEAWTMDPKEWWHVFEVNVLGVYLSCRAVIPGMILRGHGRIMITGSGASYAPGLTNAAYAPSKAAVGRFGEVLAKQLEPYRIPVFVLSPGLVRTNMTEGHFPPVGPWWTSPDSVSRLIRALASGRFDALSGRYLHAEEDEPEQLQHQVDAILANDLNAVRLRR